MGLSKSLKGKGPANSGDTSANGQEAYEPPPSPPPSHISNDKETSEEYNPPSGPPLFYSPTENPPPYHDWTVIPDTSLLPPPPVLGHEASKNNATWDEAARAHAYCDQFPLYTPSRPSQVVYQAVRDGDIILEKPREFIGNVNRSTVGGRGNWTVKSHKTCGDCVLVSTLVRIMLKLSSAISSDMKTNNLVPFSSPSISPQQTLLSSHSGGRQSISR